nr:hypothetical protein [uncultured Sphingomonas sp.]
MRHWMIGAAALVVASFAIPASAQQSSYKAGPYWNAARISVEDGQMENYLDWLGRVWADNQAYAKSQGWILDYYILGNVNRRDNEPDLILLTRFADMPSNAEAERRQNILNSRMKLDDHSADAASGGRGKMRRLMGSVLYQELQKR